MSYSPARIQNNQTLADTTVTYEVVSTTIEEYPGTEIDYTPATGAESVVYSVNFGVINNPDNATCFLNTRLQESTNNGASWSDLDGCKLFEGTTGPYADWDNISYSYCFIIPAWSGSRKLRIAGRSKDSASEYSVSRCLVSMAWQNTSPFVSVYSLMKAE